MRVTSVVYITIAIIIIVLVPVHSIGWLALPCICTHIALDSINIGCNTIHSIYN